MTLENERVLLTRLSPSLARRIIDGREEPGDAWHRDYPFADELAPLSALAATTETGSPFTMYAIREARTGLAVGGFGFFGPPDSSGTVEFGYGLIPAARGRGLATAAVDLALDHARAWGARRAIADTDTGNAASQRVLEKAGLVEVRRGGSVVFFERELA